MLPALRHSVVLYLPNATSYRGKCTGVADATVTHLVHQTAPVVLNKSELSNCLIATLLPYFLHGSHDDADRMPSTDSVTGLLECVEPLFMLSTFAGSHALKVHFLDRLVNCRISWR